MKALIIHSAHFRLPDNFNGTVSDALRLLADYHDAKKSEGVTKAPSELINLPFKTAASVLWDDFIEQIQSGKRFIGLLSLSSYDPLVELPRIGEE